MKVAIKKNNIILFNVFIVLSGIVIAIIISYFIFYYPSNKWITFQSARVPLRFNHPQDWPVSYATTIVINQNTLNESTLVEDIKFSNIFEANNPNQYLGYLQVYELSEKEDPMDYLVNKLYISSKEIRKEKIGKEYFYIESYQPASKPPAVFGLPDKERYYIFKNKYIYKLGLTNPTYMNRNKEETEKIFYKIITTMRFN